jgi:hypothetical protein
MLTIENETANYSGKSNIFPHYSIDAVVDKGTGIGINRSLYRPNDLTDESLDAISIDERVSEKDSPFTSIRSVESIRNIYFEEFITPDLRIGIKLLESAREKVTKALNSIRAGNIKDSDEFIMEFKVFLPELFCCRTISDSFGAIINAIHNALHNMKGVPLSENQIVALDVLIKGLLREPAMKFETAVDYVSEFEETDFEVESLGFQGLLKLVETMNESEASYEV